MNLTNFLHKINRNNLNIKNLHIKKKKNLINFYFKNKKNNNWIIKKSYKLYKSIFILKNENNIYLSKNKTINLNFKITLFLPFFYLQSLLYNYILSIIFFLKHKWQKKLKLNLLNFNTFLNFYYFNNFNFNSEILNRDYLKNSKKNNKYIQFFNYYKYNFSFKTRPSSDYKLYLNIKKKKNLFYNKTTFLSKFYVYLFSNYFFTFFKIKTKLIKKYKINTFLIKNTDYLSENFLYLTHLSTNWNNFQFYKKSPLKLFNINSNLNKLTFFIFPLDSFFVSDYNIFKNKKNNFFNYLNSFYKENIFVNYEPKLYKNLLLDSKFFNYFNLIQKNYNISTYSYKLQNQNFNLKFINNNYESFLLIISNPVFFKYFFYLSNIFITSKFLKFKSIYIQFVSILNNFFFYSKKSILSVTNLIPIKNFNFIFKKKVLKIFSYEKFTVPATPFFNSSLNRFFSYLTGKKILIKFYPFLNNCLNLNEKALCLNWATRLKSFRKLLGPRLFLAESLEILYISLKLKDPFFLSHWMVNMMYKISFWKYKLLFRYLKYVLRYFFFTSFKDVYIKGIKFQLKGKISVAGNARTRKVVLKIGSTSHATYDNKVLYAFNLVRTFTGVLGFKTWLFF